MGVTEFDVLKKLSYILRFYRRARGYSQQQMAEVLSISTRNFQRIENGEVEPKFETLGKIAKMLNLSVSALMRQTTADNLLMKHDLAENLMTEGSLHQAQIDGTVVSSSGEWTKSLGLQNSSFDVQSHVMVGSTVERWELIHRLNLKRVVMNNMYMFPDGIRVFKICLHNINPNPDCPKADLIFKDITASHTLDTWLQSVRSQSFLS